MSLAKLFVSILSPSKFSSSGACHRKVPREEAIELDEVNGNLESFASIAKPKSVIQACREGVIMMLA